MININQNEVLREFIKSKAGDRKYSYQGCMPSESKVKVYNNNGETFGWLNNFTVDSPQDGVNAYVKYKVRVATYMPHVTQHGALLIIFELN